MTAQFTGAPAATRNPVDPIRELDRQGCAQR